MHSGADGLNRARAPHAEGVPAGDSGRKHERKIELEAWQQVIVAGHAGDFARGLFHSDGYRGMNRVRRALAEGDRWYEYPRYLFVNHSVDILPLCAEALDRLGVEWRFSKWNTISVARRSNGEIQPIGMDVFGARSRDVVHGKPRGRSNRCFGIDTYRESSRDRSLLHWTVR